MDTIITKAHWRWENTTELLRQITVSEDAAGRIVKAGIFPECLCGILPTGPVFKRRLAGGMETF